jgi:1-deoxy-D-xylulose-5-phosphate reductoisomerase
MNTRKGLAILGSTGSIGVNTLDVVASHPDRFTVVTLAAHGNVDLIEQQARRFHPRLVVLFDAQKASLLAQRLSDSDTEIDTGLDGLCRAATYDGVDLVMSAVVGAIGLQPTIRAVEAGIDVAVANPKTQNYGQILPVDSEHNAIFQALQGHERSALRRILLTGSGGPFREWSRDEMQEVRIEDALKHPNWKMGPKITIDSATLMNKGLEVIEARWLFGVPFEQIQVVMHRESIVHSMVELTDGSIKAHLSYPDMRQPIQFALSYPERLTLDLPPVDFTRLGALHFGELDMERYPCLGILLAAGRKGGSYPAALAAADETAVGAFLEGRIRFTDIAALLADTLERHDPASETSLEAVLAADNWARSFAGSWIDARAAAGQRSR